MTSVRLNLEIGTEQAAANMGKLTGTIGDAKDASDGLTRSQENLQKTLELTGAGPAGESMGRITDALSQAVGASGALHQSLEALQRALLETGSTSGAESMAQFVDGLDQAERKAKDLAENQDSLQAELVQTGSSAEKPREAFGRFVSAADAAKTSSLGLAQGQDKLQGELKETASSAESSAEKMGEAAAQLIAMIGASRSVADTVKAYASFERTLSVVGSVANASATQLDQLQEAARTAGAATEFSATESAEALLQLARAGFDVDESIAALIPSLNLATADSLDLAEAAGIASAAIKQFNLDAQDSVRVADILVGTSNNTDSGVRDIGEALSYVGPVADALNVSLEETTAVIGVLGDNAIKGSRAGTSFARFLSGLNITTEPARAALEELGLTQEDLSLKSNSLADVLEKLRLANIDAYTAEAIFGDVARVAALKLSENVDKVRELTAANFESAGAANAASEAISDNLLGAYRELTGVIEEAQLKLGDKTGGFMRLVVDSVTDAIRVLVGLEDAQNEASAESNVLAVAIGTLAGPTAMGLLISTANGAWRLLKLLGAFTPQGRIALWATAGASAIYSMAAALSDAKSESEEFAEELEGVRRATERLSNTKLTGGTAPVFQLDGAIQTFDKALESGDLAGAEKSLAYARDYVAELKALAEQQDGGFSVRQFEGLSPALDNELLALEERLETGLAKTVGQGMTLGLRSGVASATSGIAKLLDSFAFPDEKDQEAVFAALKTAREELADISLLEGTKQPIRATLQFDIDASRDAAEEAIKKALNLFQDKAQLDLVNAETIAAPLDAVISSLEAKLRDAGKAIASEASIDSQKVSPEEIDKIGGDSDALADFIRQQQILSQSVGRSNDELEVLRAQAEAFENVKALGLPAAVAFANVIGLEVSQRQSLAKALEEEARLNQIGTEERARMVDEVIAYEQALKDARAAEREAAFDTLSQLNSAVAFDLKTLGLNSDQRRRVYEDEIALQAALKIGAEEGAAAYAEYVRLADSAEFATRGQRAADFLSDSFTAFSVQATQDFDNVGDAFEQLMNRLEAQVLNATFGGLFQNIFQNLVGTTLGAGLGSAFGFGSPTPTQAGPPGGIGPVYGLGSSGTGPSSLGGGLGVSLGEKGYGGAGGYDGFGKGLDVSVSLGDKFDQMVAKFDQAVVALGAIATKVGAPASPSYVPQVARGYEPTGMGLSDRQLAEQARRRFGR